MTLKQYMQKKNISCIQLGQELGVTRQSIYNWLKAEEDTFNHPWDTKYIPSAKMMSKIYNVTGKAVKPSSFYPLT